MDKANLQQLLSAMKPHTKKPELTAEMYKIFQNILTEPDSEPLAGGLSSASSKALEVANKSGVTKQVTKQVTDTAAAPAKQRTIALLMEGICLLTVLAPPGGDMDVRTAGVDPAAPNLRVRVRTVALTRLIACLSPNVYRSRVATPCCRRCERNRTSSSCSCWGSTISSTR